MSSEESDDELSCHWPVPLELHATHLVFVDTHDTPYYVIVLVGCCRATQRQYHFHAIRMIRSLISVARTALDRTALASSSQFFRPTPQLALAGVGGVDVDPGVGSSVGAGLFDALWLAVPKSRVTKGKKRMKTTNQKRIAKKANIITDARTGELTLMHKLPFKWKEYLPKM